ncbi:sensor histidine kinase [Nocardia sp. NPDC003979]
MAVTDRRWITAGLSAAATCAVAVWAMLASWSVTAPYWWEEAPPRLVGIVVLVTGIAVWIRLPSPRVGRLIVLGSALYYVQFFRAADGFLFTFGFCMAYAWTAVAAHVLLTWPTGRLGDTIDRVFIAVAYPAAIGTQVVRYLVDRPRSPWALHVDQSGTLWGTIGSASAAVLFLVAIGLAVRRWLSSPVRYLPSGPVSVGIALAASVKFAEAVASVVSTSFFPRLALGWLFTVTTMILMPVLYLVTWLYRKFGHRRVIDLLLSLQDDVATLTDPLSLQRALSRTLGDSTLLVAYRQDSGGYVDVHGRPVTVEDSRPGRAITPLRRGEAIIAVIEHDAVLMERRELIDAALAAVGLAVENTRLYAVLQAQVEQIRASRLRLTQTAFEERQRIQRDLHDGAQQRFFVVLMLLDRAQRLLPTGPDFSADVHDSLHRAHAELTEALRGLRNLVQGIYPTDLAEHGLATAVSNLVDQAPTPVDFAITETRWARHIEMTAYFVISEALANAYKHADATSVRVDVASRDHCLVTTISDNGRGGVEHNGGLGLASLRNRVDAVGGTLAIHSPHGGGTTLTATFPQSATRQPIEKPEHL